MGKLLHQAQLTLLHLVPIQVKQQVQAQVTVQHLAPLQVEQQLSGPLTKAQLLRTQVKAPHLTLLQAQVAQLQLLPLTTYQQPLQFQQLKMHRFNP